MAINWTDAQIEQVVAAVIKNLGGNSVSKSGWDSTQYNGRKLIGEAYAKAVAPIIK